MAGHTPQPETHVQAVTTPLVSNIITIIIIITLIITIINQIIITLSIILITTIFRCATSSSPRSSRR